MQQLFAVLQIDVQQITSFVQLMLSLINLILFGVAFLKFLNKPHDTLADEVKQLKIKVMEQEVEIKELKKQIDASFVKHREQEKTNTVFKRVFMLLANFEVAFCLHTGYEHTEDLLKAKEELDGYLSGS